MRLIVPDAVVAPFDARVRRALLLRSFLVQGSWNYETLIGTGFAFVLLPALRYVHRSDPDALRAALIRHAEVFNSHPYLTPLAAGAVARLEAEGTAPELVTRFKSALRGSLGSLGDQLIWLSLRPVAALLAITLLLIGAPWWLAVAAFLVGYNAVHLWMRAWGLRLGLREGLSVGRALREVPFGAWQARATDVGAVLAGLCTVLAVGRAGATPLWIGIAAAVAAAGLLAGLRLRRPVYQLLLLLWLVGLGFGGFL